MKKRKPFIERRKHTPDLTPVETNEQRDLRLAKRAKFIEENPDKFTFTHMPIV